MTLDTRPTALYRTAGERAVRAPSPAHAAWALANRMARREHGRHGAAMSVYLTGYSERGEAAHYRGSLVARNGYSVSVDFVVRGCRRWA